MALRDRRVLDELEAGELAAEYDDREPEELIRWALERFGVERVGLCTSFQVDGMALLDMAWRIDPRVRVFTIDTGRLPPETYDLMDEVRRRYGLPVEVYLPDAAEVEALVGRHGANLFYRSVDLRLLCCQARKVKPLLRALEGLDAWITGLRRDQWASRANLRKIEIDHDHGGLAKVNPLADRTEEEIWEYVRARDVPCSRLYGQGYTSIGCAPCTRPTGPGEDPRAGRWWWEKGAPKECGIHCPLETGAFEHEAEVLLGGR